MLIVNAINPRFIDDPEFVSFYNEVHEDPSNPLYGNNRLLFKHPKASTRLSHIQDNVRRLSKQQQGAPIVVSSGFLHLLDFDGCEDLDVYRIALMSRPDGYFKALNILELSVKSPILRDKDRFMIPDIDNIEQDFMKWIIPIRQNNHSKEFLEFIRLSMGNAKRFVFKLLPPILGPVQDTVAVLGVLLRRISTVKSKEHYIPMFENVSHAFDASHIKEALKIQSPQGVSAIDRLSKLNISVKDIFTSLEI